MACSLCVVAQVYNRANGPSVYGQNESISLLVTAVRSLILRDGDKGAPLGVVGLEMIYDKFAGLVEGVSGGMCSVSHISILRNEHPYMATFCLQKQNMRCFLLDEHGKFFLNFIW